MPEPNEIYKFGPYTYPDCVIESGPKSTGARLRTGDTPNHAGGYSEGGILASRRINMKGVIQWYSGNGRAQLDAFWAAHVPGKPQKLYYGYDDRFFWAEVDGTSDPGSESLVGAMRFEIGYYMADPYEYSDSVTTVALGTSGGPVNVSGTAPAAPILRFALSQVAASATVTLTNQTTGESLTLDATQLGAYAVDTKAGSVTRFSMPADAALIAGWFWELAPGANSILLGTSSGAQIEAGSASVEFRNRWY